MNKDKIMKVILIIVLIMNLVIFFKVKDIKRDLGNINSSISYLDSKISNIDSNINELDKFIVRLDSYVDVKDVTEAGYLLNVDVSFKELLDGEEPYIVYRSVVYDTNAYNRTYTDWTNVKLNKTSTLTYDIDLALTYGKDYEYKIITQGVRERSSDLSTVASSDHDPVAIKIDKSYTNNDSGEFTIYAYNRYSLEGYDVDKIKVTIPLLSKEYEAVRIGNELDKYDIKPQGVGSEMYQIVLPPEDYDNLKGKLISVTIEVICKNGFKIINNSEISNF